MRQATNRRWVGGRAFRVLAAVAPIVCGLLLTAGCDSGPCVEGSTGCWDNDQRLGFCTVQAEWVGYDCTKKCQEEYPDLAIKRASCDQSFIFRQLACICAEGGLPSEASWKPDYVWHGHNALPVGEVD